MYQNVPADLTAAVFAHCARSIPKDPIFKATGPFGVVRMRLNSFHKPVRAYTTAGSFTNNELAEDYFS